MTDTLTIEINGRACEASPGEMIIAVADREGISIPRFCYHKKLSIAANCRMCLVEAEQGGRPFPKPVPACATPVFPGMKVQTRSPKAIEAQRSVMEFLLINHPLDCPICDQGGECELQDVAMGYGADCSRFTEGKRVVMDEDLGPLIATDMTRCIQCTRCVRFGAEIAGLRELGGTGRGEWMRIGTYVDHPLTHELSGNIIDLCPVGALTAKPSRFTARAWELTARDGIAPHDGVGSNLRLHVRRGQVMRVHPRDNETVNETWLSDRDRFSYVGLNGADRLTEPLVKREGRWVAVEWTEALTLVAERLKAADAHATGWLIAPNATLEEMYLAQGIARGLGCPNIDHRLRQRDFRGEGADPRLPWLGVSIPELQSQESVLLIGSDIRAEHPLLAHRLRQAVLADGSLTLVNPARVDLTHPATQLAQGPAGMVGELAAIAAALGASGFGILRNVIAGVKPSAEHQAIAASLRSAGGNDIGLILLGALAAAHPDYTLLKALAYVIAGFTRCKVGYLPAAANSVGAALAGALPGVLPGGEPAARRGLPVSDILAAPCRTVVLWGLEPDLDLGNPRLAMDALAQADFVVAASAFRSESLESVADVLLPIGAFAETSGTFVNAAGTWQSFQGAVPPPGSARPGWKILRVLGNLLDLQGFEYRDTAEIRTELATQCAAAPLDNTPVAELGVAPLGVGEGLVRLGDVPPYAIDPLVRRCGPLQRTAGLATIGVWLNAAQAADLGLAAGDVVEVSQDGPVVRTRVLIDQRVPFGCARIPAGVPGSETLGDQFAPISIVKAE
ncbi:NADH-quinone oxidoreductase subunit NuoG [uncultured Thiodictyon sp.]|uniref:NADH-quinone oxidoreductase subunit NuoG n=1 Tax=uncultured Thiodictyon sp. TaxID=1846217 RepID=UPI0025F7AFD4|nr:NADH-quinone oxidoreductase subunit NuoG [uncultured Thiodictyon sp.]